MIYMTLYAQRLIAQDSRDLLINFFILPMCKGGGYDPPRFGSESRLRFPHRPHQHVFPIRFQVSMVSKKYSCISPWGLLYERIGKTLRRTPTKTLVLECFWGLYGLHVKCETKKNFPRFDSESCLVFAGIQPHTLNTRWKFDRDFAFVLFYRILVGG